MLYIGSHVSFKSDSQLLGSVKEALSYNANIFMFYTGAPQNTQRTSINDFMTIEALKLMKENDMELDKIICHAPYIINLANNLDIKKYEFAYNFLRNEMDRCEELGITKLVLHPGSATSIPREEALDNIIYALNKVMIESDKVVILLETMAGKGTELGKSIDELKYIIDHIELKNHIGVCLDTCHLNDSGVDISKFDDYLEEFDSKIGLDYIKCVHINDSKNPIESHKDRHENFGFGTIGFNNLIDIIYNKKLENIPFILETPYIDKEYPPYKFEIDMIRNKEFNENLYSDVVSFYKNGSDLNE